MTARQFWYRYVYQKSPAWKLTKQLRKKDHCQKCGGRGVLHLHHEKYYSFLTWWNVLNLIIPDLISPMKTLCARCHAKAHGK